MVVLITKEYDENVEGGKMGTPEKNKQHAVGAPPCVLELTA